MKTKFTHTSQIYRLIRRFPAFLFDLLSVNIYVGRHVSQVPGHSIIFFPYRQCLLCCGLAGIVAVNRKNKSDDHFKTVSFEETINNIETGGFANCQKNKRPIDDHYLGGEKQIDTLWQNAQVLKKKGVFFEVFRDRQIQDKINTAAGRLSQILAVEENILSENMGSINPEEFKTIAGRIERLKDIHWCLSTEILSNIFKIKDLIHPSRNESSPEAVAVFKEINTVLNSIDRLEVRGRDSAGISLMLRLKKEDFIQYQNALGDLNLLKQLTERSRQDVLVNKSICLPDTKDMAGKNFVAISIVYKIAAEIGNLGDNSDFLRKQLKEDMLFQILMSFPFACHTVLSHTRWASVGAITESNCHPVDNHTIGDPGGTCGRIHVCLNGDIDNYQELKAAYENSGNRIHSDITTDTKIIPLQIEKYFSEGFNVEEAFRRAVNDFEGSHAISMHTDLAPGKLFLAQKGSGQAIFIGLSEDYYMPTSEVYGFIEETPCYLKMDGEKIVAGQNGDTQGQIIILSHESEGGLDGLQAMFYDGTPIKLTPKDIKHTEITTRDIDRQGFSHYFLKEISESPSSVEKTLQNRWKATKTGKKRYELSLDEKVLPLPIKKALSDNTIRRVYFVGQGTAGVAALACSNILDYYLGDSSFNTSALKSSELSGFKLTEHDEIDCMSDALVVAITQSGTTTDTNRTIDMVRERGAHTIAIVNRRDSDITFKVDGVMYTSTGRDLEMSVASTKAFYSQIVAGALLSLYIAQLKGAINNRFVSDEIQHLLELPNHMRKVLTLEKDIDRSARQYAVTKTYWAAVGSGPNKAAADEIRIKLSELCYKTISSDFIEDKKHIDLSSEPLIIVCAAGTKGHVIGDIIKDTAIFQAHKATPIIIADEGEERFNPYAADVFHVPAVKQHLAPIVNTLVGHLWGYYAALAINEGSRFLYNFRKNIQDTLNKFSDKGLDVYEVILENRFREKIAHFYTEFRRKKNQKQFPSDMGLKAASDLTLLLKYLSGSLPVSDFELDFGKKGTALNMLNTLFECVGEAINCMARPIDAIKHQAKTVTVGTSRISEKVEGVLFDALSDHNFNVSNLANNNIIVLKNLQGIVSRIQGLILYRTSGLSLLGELTDQTTIKLEKKEGSLQPLVSRVEKDQALKGTKRIIVRQKNVYIGKGRKDDRNIIIIPIMSGAPNTPNIIENLLLLHIAFKTDIPLAVKIKALGGKYEHIKNIVQENSIAWEDTLIGLVDMDKLFGVSAEKIGEFIASVSNNSSNKA